VERKTKVGFSFWGVFLGGFTPKQGGGFSGYLLECLTLRHIAAWCEQTLDKVVKTNFWIFI